LEEREQWRYQQVIYEQEPAVKSLDDARSRFDASARLKEPALEDCYHMALYRSEALAIDGEELVRLQAQYEEARGEVLPRISFKGSLLKQDATGVSSSGSFQRSFTEKEKTQFQFAGHQPIFGGLREFYALRQSSALYRAREEDLRHARLFLFADVADAFYVVLQAERDLATTQNSLALAEERLEELVQRNRAGISRRSEVLAQEAETASTRAGLERLKGALAVAWEALKFLTGLPGPRKLRDSLPEPGTPDPLETYLGRARDSRSDLKALDHEIAAAEESIGVARAGYFPMVNLDANYYTHREGFSKEIDWDTTLSFEIPIFEGAVTQARLREARSGVRSARFRRERIRREIDLEVNRSFAELRSLQGELESLGKAVASAEENYEIVQAEYRRGIVTNIEVLSAFNTLLRATLARDRSRFQSKLAFVRLEVQSGALPGGIK
jgi:outer membrane protein TolC